MLMRRPKHVDASYQHLVLICVPIVQKSSQKSPEKHPAGGEEQAKLMAYEDEKSCVGSGSVSSAIAAAVMKAIEEDGVRFNTMPVTAKTATTS